MPHSCVENYLHIIFSTKNREPLIAPQIENRLHSYIVGISRQNKVPIRNYSDPSPFNRARARARTRARLNNVEKE
jgi:Transposase IS200 like